MMSLSSAPALPGVGVQAPRRSRPEVALLEAGRPQSDKNFTEHKPSSNSKYRNRAPEIVRKTRPIQVKFRCLQRIYIQLVRQRSGRALYNARRQALWTGWAASA